MKGRRFAWFGAGHPGERITCPECESPPGRRCTYGNIELAGLHAARVVEGDERAREVRS